MYWEQTKPDPVNKIMLRGEEILKVNSSDWSITQIYITMHENMMVVTLEKNENSTLKI